MESNIYNTMFPLDNEYSSLVEKRPWMDNPEIRLLWAIIERAARDAMGNNRRERDAATDWFLEESKGLPEEFSFQWICETLETNSEELLNKVFPERDEPFEYKLAS